MIAAAAAIAEEFAMSAKHADSVLARLPRWSDYPAGDLPGFWDPKTSTLTWCEQKYYATTWCAEIINTLTNLLFLLLALRGLANCIRHGHDTIFAVGFLGYGLVGFASFLFHSTQWYWWQIADEMSMIVITMIMLYATLSYRRSNPWRVFLALALSSTTWGIGAYYHHSKNPVFHQTMYALLTIFVLSHSGLTMYTQLRTDMKARGSDAEPIIRMMTKLVAQGMVVFLGGFLCWNLDNALCHKYLRPWRQTVGMPWGFLLEGHGWWHLMTGTGAYFYLVWGLWLRHCLEGRERDYRLIWTSRFRLPELVRIGQGHGGSSKQANGSTPNGVRQNGRQNGGPKVNGRAKLNGKSA